MLAHYLESVPGEHPLTTQDICSAVRHFADALETHRRTIDLLNVYPVPDGDTGTNMTLTLSSVSEALDELPTSELSDRGAVCEAIAKSALMGARGNSGVIISQFLRAMVHVFAQAPEEIGSDHLAAGLAAGSASADASVQEPVEGTILSVARAAATAATQTAATSAESVTQVLTAARQAGQTALEKTPQQLAVLAAAGVVDAGAVGFLLWLDALLVVADDRPLPKTLDLPSEVTDTIASLSLQTTQPDTPAAVAAQTGANQSVANTTNASLGPRYEVMYLLDSDDELVAEFRNAWSELGDSIVVAGGDGLWNCHIHTDLIGASIEAGITAGRPHRIAITDLHEQVGQLEHEREHSSGHPTEHPITPSATCAVIVVSPAAGVNEIFAGLGANAFISGGQTMNPSTAEILAAIEAVDSNEVVLLPNNSNIIATAQQATEHTSKQVHVVPTRTITHGVGAMIGFDPISTAAHNADQMADFASSVTAGEVTQAVRSTVAQSTGAQVNEGDWIGLSSEIVGHIAAVSDNPSQSAIELLGQLIQPHHDVLTVITGADAAPVDTQAIKAWLAEAHADIQAEFLAGGQAHYPYLFGLE